MNNELSIPSDQQLQLLCKNAIQLVKEARGYSLSQVNQTQLLTYYTIGKWIVEVQQSGSSRAKYGQKVLKTLSDEMNHAFGKGFSVATLTSIRKFYDTYKDRLSTSLPLDWYKRKSQPPVTIFDGETPFLLSWSHYLILMRIDNRDERSFYEIEAQRQGWGKRELGRQYASSLYERMLIGKDKNKIMEMSQKGHIIDNADDMVKEWVNEETGGNNE